MGSIVAVGVNSRHGLTTLRRERRLSVQQTHSDLFFIFSFSHFVFSYFTLLFFFAVFYFSILSSTGLIIFQKNNIFSPHFPILNRLFFKSFHFLSSILSFSPSSQFHIFPFPCVPVSPPVPRAVTTAPPPRVPGQPSRWLSDFPGDQMGVPVRRLLQGAHPLGLGGGVEWDWEPVGQTLEGNPPPPTIRSCPAPPPGKGRGPKSSTELRDFKKLFASVDPRHTASHSVILCVGFVISSAKPP